MNIEFSRNNDIFKIKSLKEHQDKILRYRSTETLELSSVKKSAFVKKIVQKDPDTFYIYINPARKIACGIPHKIASMLKVANPMLNLCLDEDLINMDEDEELIFKPKVPIWVMDNKGSVVIIKRIYAK